MPKKNAAYRSKFEARIGASLSRRGSGARYEPVRIGYTVPASKHAYTPDWVLTNGIVIEAKGRLTAADRKKMLAVRRDNPHLDIRFVFQRAANVLRRGSATTYADWCNKNGFKWAEGDIPDEWIDE